ncbi:PAS domain-containing protein [Methanofollis tationis]|uniref:PAS domain-containing protein n=1 Tax=Methanofollis tationis TaxID=81417 RepID=A0A7K4HNC5_9EURY|nr:PAS domain-containing protein [Methanofollis tationis]NVO66771.1 PAS domain-containing protein [Methanofollis tationis]
MDFPEPYYPNKQKISILYIDDEPALVEIGKLFLQRGGNMAVTTATSAEEALSTLATATFDGVVSDLQMPGMDGIELLREVRRLYGPLPFIIFTGKEREEVVIEALNAGVDYYLQKGGAPKTLFADLEIIIIQAVEKRRIARALEESEERYRTVVEDQTEMICWFDPDSVILFANEAFCRYFGVPAAGVIGRSDCHALIHPSDPPGPLLADIVVGRGKKGAAGLHDASRWDYESLTGEDTAVTGDGEERVLQGRATPLRGPDGEIVGAIESLRDVTEIRAGERTLHEANALLEWTFDALPEIVGIMRPDRRIIRYNRAGYEALGMTPEEVVGKPCYSLIGRARPCEVCATEMALKSRKTETIEKYVPERDLHLRCTSVPIFDKNGEVCLIVEHLAPVPAGEGEAPDDALTGAGTS